VGTNDPRRQLLLELLRAALTAVDGRQCTRQALRALPAGSYWVAAVGKAASSMALGASDALGDKLRRVLLITKEGHVAREALELPGVDVWESSHPVPDERTLQAGARLLRFVEEIPEHVLPIFLVSGGASSLVEVLAPGFTLEDLQRLNIDGLSSAIDIEELNARRRVCSRIKGGRLSALLRGRAARALFISDVPGNDPAVIGSGVLGPAPGASGRASAADGIERTVIASIEMAMHAVSARAAHGLPVHVETRRVTETAERLAVRLAHELAVSATPLRVWGGETVVRLPEHPGRGGRNQHLALSAARLIAGYEELRLLAVGTDGTDGPTPDAGALVDGNTCARAASSGVDVDDCLRRADSAAALEAAGDLVHTGPTGTNVGDLIIGLKLSAAAAADWLRAAPSSHASARDR
jgi:hydroxypyruvate reductase